MSEKLDRILVKSIEIFMWFRNERKMKIIAIVIVIAVCFENIQATRTSNRRISRKQKSIGRLPSSVSKGDQQQDSLKSTNKPSQNVSSNNEQNNEIPYLVKGKVTYVEGKDGKIFVDSVALFDYDDELKKGKMHFVVTDDNDVKVNDRLVLRKRPQDPRIIPLDHDIARENVLGFQARFNEKGGMNFVWLKRLPRDEDKKSSVDPNVPFLVKGKVTYVEGKDGKIFVDGVALFDYDEELKKGKMHFVVTDDNDVKVNDRLVLRKRPQDPRIIPLDHDIARENVLGFQARFNEKGGMNFVWLKKLPRDEDKKSSARV